jgi:hypothetical protein
VDPTGAPAELRVLVRLPKTLVDERTAWQQRLHAVLFHHGLLCPWAPTVSRGLLEAMGAKEAWDLLNHPRPATHPPVTDGLRHHAQSDAPRPTGTYCLERLPNRRLGRHPDATRPRFRAGSRTDEGPCNRPIPVR